MFNFALRMKHQRIALFISGKGSNARNIIQFFQNHGNICVSLVLSSTENPEMKAHCKAQQVAFESSSNLLFEDYFRICQANQIDWIILAGFLKKVPADLVQLYPHRMINIHPALLPNFGGKGMYGVYVHKAVAASKMHFSGITIHMVNEEFDKGKVLAQFAVSLKNPSSPEYIETEVRKLEMKHFPSVIESVICGALIE
jgi:phosphoribosylglycinamide formyltransferase-1